MPSLPMIKNTNSILAYKTAAAATPVEIASDSPFKHFIFPLNVYAHALLLQEGEVSYLHYGLFQNDRTTLRAAQQYSTDLLFGRLPSPPCRILEVGVGLGTTLTLLNQANYHAHGITPDSRQIDYIRSLALPVSVSNHAFESLTAQSESYDFVFFQESAQYIDPLVIFSKAADLLAPSGELLIIDEFALKFDQENTAKFHLLQDAVALAERFGFELIEHLDLSAMAAPTLDYLLHLTRLHRNRLIQDLALTEGQLSQLDQSNREYRNKYASGHYGYALLHFRKKTHPKWCLQLLEKKDTKEIFDLFEKTFHHTMTPATWQWKYGTHLSYEVGVRREHKLIGHYGGTARSILFFGRPETAVQIGDVMVDPVERGVLTRKGPFFLMAATFLERYIGYGKPYLIGFGFPNERAMKVAERLGLYAEIGRMIECAWKTRSRFPLLGTRLQLITHDSTDTTATIVNECWHRMAADLQTAAVGVRDWPYLLHRYLNHPDQQYRIFLVKNRIGGHARGILVLRYDPDECEIIDLVSPLAEIPLLVKHARRLAGMQGAHRVFCHITENFVSRFAATGGTRQAVNIRIPTNVWSSGPAPEALKNRWWLMSGDKDFR
ncbi:MAG: GNAT family N-acetyltransferase [Nitrosomonas sp.]|nr:MAG: GNAT family N-acetyltransferase [Nitrosomonas sp.]